MIISFSSGEYDDYARDAYFDVPSKGFAEEKLKQYIEDNAEYNIYQFLDRFRKLPEVVEVDMPDIWMGAYGRWTTEL